MSDMQPLTNKGRKYPYAVGRFLASFAGILQADAYGGYNQLYSPDRQPGLIISALCWSHGRRKFFELADIAANPKR